MATGCIQRSFVNAAVVLVGTVMVVDSVVLVVVVVVVVVVDVDDEDSVTTRPEYFKSVIY